MTMNEYKFGIKYDDNKVRNSYVVAKNARIARSSLEIELINDFCAGDLAGEIISCVNQGPINPDSYKGF